ncbi:MAG: hypothetical protein AB1Z67_02715 [Candidatus Limnocylindrales bacterium]
MRVALAVAVGAALLVLLVAAVVAGAEPAATAAAVLETGDLRSEGEGPGLVGNPLLILVAVVGLGLASAGVTVLLARLTRRSRT